MSLLVRAAPSSHYEWLTSRLGLFVTPAFRAIEAIDPKTAEIKGMCGYDAWTPNSCQMHVAIESSAATRALLHPAFKYPFLQARREVAIGLVSQGNKRSCNFARHLGFRDVGRIQDGWAPGVPLLVFEMRRSECRWLAEPKRKAA